MAYKEISASLDPVADKHREDPNFVYPGLEKKLKQFLKSQENSQHHVLDIGGIDKFGQYQFLQIIDYSTMGDKNPGIFLSIVPFENQEHEVKMSKINNDLSLEIEEGCYFKKYGSDYKKASNDISKILVNVYGLYQIEYDKVPKNINSSQGGCMVIFLLLSSSFFTLLFLIVS